MRSLQTAVPLGVCRSSGSRVRLPTRTTRLMLAIPLLLLLRTFVRSSVRRLGDGIHGRGRLRATSGDAADGEVAHDAVRDLEDPGELGERLRLAVECEQVVRAFGLVLDLVRELAPAPYVVRVPPAAAALDELARARDDLVLALLGELRIQHEQDLVGDQRSRTSFPRSESASPAGAAGNERREARQEAGASVASPRAPLSRVARWCGGRDRALPRGDPSQLRRRAAARAGAHTRAARAAARPARRRAPAQARGVTLARERARRVRERRDDGGRGAAGSVAGRPSPARARRGTRTRGADAIHARRIRNRATG